SRVATIGKQIILHELEIRKNAEEKNSNLIGYVFRPESTQNPTNPIPHLNDLTFQSILSILAEKGVYQFIKYSNTWTLINSLNSSFNKSKTQYSLSLLNVPLLMESNFSPQNEVFINDFQEKSPQKNHKLKMEFNSDKKSLDGYRKEESIKDERNDCDHWYHNSSAINGLRFSQMVEIRLVNEQRRVIHIV
ncbi:hypothetical protein BpHYR1_040787, partial [Brachionus plicatilis]